MAASGALTKHGFPRGYLFSPENDEMAQILDDRLRGRPLPPPVAAVFHDIRILDYHPQQLYEQYKAYQEAERIYFFSEQEFLPPAAGSVRAAPDDGSRKRRPVRTAHGGSWKPSGGGKAVTRPDNDAVVVGRMVTMVFYDRRRVGAVERHFKTNWGLHEYTVPVGPNKFSTLAAYRLYKVKNTAGKGGSKQQAKAAHHHRVPADNGAPSSSAAGSSSSSTGQALSTSSQQQKQPLSTDQIQHYYHDQQYAFGATAMPAQRTWAPLPAATNSPVPAAAADNGAPSSSGAGSSSSSTGQSLSTSSQQQKQSLSTDQIQHYYHDQQYAFGATAQRTWAPLPATTDSPVPVACAPSYFFHQFAASSDQGAVNPGEHQATATDHSWVTPLPSHVAVSPPRAQLLAAGCDETMDEASSQQHKQPLSIDQIQHYYHNQQYAFGATAMPTQRTWVPLSAATDSPVPVAGAPDYFHQFAASSDQGAVNPGEHHAPATDHSWVTPLPSHVAVSPPRAQLLAAGCDGTMDEASSQQHKQPLSIDQIQHYYDDQYAFGATAMPVQNTWAPLPAATDSPVPITGAPGYFHQFAASSDQGAVNPGEHQPPATAAADHSGVTPLPGHVTMSPPRAQLLAAGCDETMDQASSQPQLVLPAVDEDYMSSILNEVDDGPPMDGVLETFDDLFMPDGGDFLFTMDDLTGADHPSSEDGNNQAGGTKEHSHMPQF